MDKFNWDIIMCDKTCVKIKNEKQFEKIKKEYVKKFGKGFFNGPVYDCEYYQFSTGNISDGYRYWYRNNKDYFIENNYTILKYKDVRIRKENIVCEKKETFQDWLKSYLKNYDQMESNFSDIEKPLLHYDSAVIFHSDKEYTDFLVENIIIKCIEYYNNIYSDKIGNYYLLYDKSTERINYDTNSGKINIIKKSMIMNNVGVYQSVYKEMTDFNGKNLLKYYFTGEF